MTTNQTYERITIKVGELGYDAWKQHFNRMTAHDYHRLILREIAVQEDGAPLCLGAMVYPLNFNEDFTYTPVYPAKVSEPPPEPLKHYVWVDGKPLPTKPHNTRQKALDEGHRLVEKENKWAVVCTDIIKPVTRAEIVELEKG